MSESVLSPQGAADSETDGAENWQTRPVILLGDEAVALGALHAGLSAAYGYPGTPSTEIFEYLERVGPSEYGITAHWAVNEKTAYEQALGVSMMGRRTLVSMKHVGLNVAGDPFMNSGLVGIRGGLVLAIADDPGMHSSQNEQDSRWLADLARVPVLEPANQQEAYEMTRQAFDLSEALRLPVMVRMVTRLCHSRAAVLPREAREQSAVSHDAGNRDWTLLPANARRLWANLLEQWPAVVATSDSSEWNWLESEYPLPEPAPLIITTGIARNYLDEVRDATDLRFNHLHLGMYPIPERLIREATEGVSDVLVMEEGYPYVERLLRGLTPGPITVRGKMSGHVPATGELDPDRVRRAFGLSEPLRVELPNLTLPARPPQLCKGCPHGDAFAAVRQALAGFSDSVVTGDIGCYTLGALPPHNAMESCVCMGASIGMAKGASDAGLRPALAVIGDSTFLHSGVTGLMDAVAHDTPMTVLILDNETVGMTGQQPTALPGSRLGPLIHGLGVDPDHLHVVETHPKRVAEFADILRTELAHPGLSVIVGVRECIVAARRRKAEERKARK